MGVVTGWQGRFFEDFTVGDVYRSRLGRTITETDNIWFTNLTLNTNQSHFNTPFAEKSPFGKPLVNSAFTLSLVTGLSVTDVSENAMANLAWDDIKLPESGLRRRHAVVRVGGAGAARVGLAPVRGHRRASARAASTSAREVVIEFRRKMMVYKRDAEQVQDLFPITDADWGV